MILNRNKSLGVKNDKILWVQSLKKHPEGWKWRMEKRKKKRRKERERDYWCFLPRRPCSRVRISVLFSLFVTWAFFPSFLLLLFIRHSSAVSSGRLHSAPCLHSYLLFLSCFLTLNLCSSFSGFVFSDSIAAFFFFFVVCSTFSAPQDFVLIDSEFFSPFPPSSLLLMIH